MFDYLKEIPGVFNSSLSFKWENTHFYAAKEKNVSTNKIGIDMSLFENIKTPVSYGIIIKNDKLHSNDIVLFSTF